MRIRFTGAIVGLAGAAVLTLAVMPIAGQAPQGGRAGGRGAGAPAAPAAPAVAAAPPMPGEEGAIWLVWCVGAAPALLPPPKRLALASRLIVRPMHNAMAMLRKRFIKGIPVCGDTRAMLHS